MKSHCFQCAGRSEWSLYDFLTRVGGRVFLSIFFLYLVAHSWWCGGFLKSVLWMQWRREKTSCLQRIQYIWSTVESKRTQKGGQLTCFEPLKALSHGMDAGSSSLLWLLPQLVGFCASFCYGWAGYSSTYSMQRRWLLCAYWPGCVAHRISLVVSTARRQWLDVDYILAKRIQACPVLMPVTSWTLEYPYGTSRAAFCISYNVYRWGCLVQEP